MANFKTYHLYFLVLTILIVACSKTDIRQSIDCNSSNTTIERIRELTKFAEKNIRLDSLLKIVDNMDTDQPRYCADRISDSLLINLYDIIGKSTIYTDPALAKVCFRKALIIRKNKYAKLELGNIVKNYYNLGLLHSMIKDYHQAIQYYDSALSNAFVIKPQFPNLVRLRIGEAFFMLGEYSQALFYYENIAQTGYNLDEEAKLELVYSTARAYKAMKIFSQGIEKVQNLTKSKNLSFDDKHNYQYGNIFLIFGNTWGDSLNNQLNANNKKQIGDTALKYLEISANWFKKYPVANHRLKALSSIYGNIAEINRRVGRFEQGLEGLDRFISSYPNISLSSKTHLFLIRGEIYFDQNKLYEARLDYDSALICLLPNIKLTNKKIPHLRGHTDDRSKLMTLMDNMARLHIRIHEQNPSNTEALEQGINWYDSLFQYITYLRGDLISDEAKLNLAEQSQPILEKAMEGCIQLYRLRKDARYLERVFTLSEQSKAFTLLEASRLKNLSESLPRELRELEQRLDQERSVLERKLAALSPESPDRKELDNLRSKNFNEIRLFLQRLKDEQSLYYRIKYKGADLKIPELQESLLKPDQALVEYHYTDSTLCILVVRKDALEARFVPISRSVLETKVHTFKQLLENPGTLVSETREQRILSLGGELYEVLWSPIVDLLPERVTIIPHAVLNTLPFEALYTGCGSLRFSDAIKNSEFLLQRQAVSYSFSANLLHEMQQIRPRTSYAGGKKTALLQTDFHHGLSANPRSQSMNEGLLQARKYLVPLGRPQAREINAIKEKITSAKIFPTATKDDFIAAATKYQIIHVATHGILNERDPSLSFISFTQAQDSLNPDELLFIKDFKPYNWGLDLVFFSACQTANGRYREGEGNISMARGLTTAGVRSFVSTLWDVPVDAKAKIAPDFYDNYLKQNKPKDLSLTLAKRKVAKEYPDPVHWSGYVLIGASD